MKKILSLSLCLVMLLACVALSACFGKKDGSSSRLSYDKVKANLQEKGYSVEEARSSDIEDLEEEIYEDYYLEVDVKQAFYAVNYSTYGYVMVAELSKSSEAEALADAFGYDYSVTHSEGKLAFAASSQSALDDALGGSYSSNSGYPSNTNSGYYPDYSSNTNSGYYPDYSTNSSSSDYGDSSYSLNGFYSNLNGYSFLYPDSLSSSEISSLESVLTNYYVYEDIYAAVMAEYGNDYIYVIEYYTASDAILAYEDLVYYDYGENYVQRDYDIVIFSSAQYLIECAYSTYYGGTPSNGSSSSDSITGNGYKSGDIETTYFSMSEFKSNLEDYNVYLEILDDYDEAQFVDSFVEQYTYNSVYKVGQGYDYYDRYIVIIEFMNHDDAVEFYYAAYNDLYNNDVYYIVVRGESVIITDYAVFIDYADGSY